MEALDLEHDRPDVLGPPRDADSRGRLDGLGVADGVDRAADAADPLGHEGDLVVADLGLAELLDAPVGHEPAVIAALDRLSVDIDREMRGLVEAGMERADGDGRRSRAAPRQAGRRRPRRPAARGCTGLPCGGDRCPSGQSSARMSRLGFGCPVKFIPRRSMYSRSDQPAPGMPGVMESNDGLAGRGRGPEDDRRYGPASKAKVWTSPSVPLSGDLVVPDADHVSPAEPRQRLRGGSGGAPRSMSTNSRAGGGRRCRSRRPASS